LKYEKIDICLDNCMLFWKEHANEKKCLECRQSKLGGHHVSGHSPSQAGQCFLK
jgi:hypothetical protein